MKDKGWECPKCGKVYAPWMPSCADCNKPKPLQHGGWTLSNQPPASKEAKP